MSLTLTTVPRVEPVSLDELKGWLGIYVDDDNSLLQSLIVAARQYAEAITWRQFITATYTWKISHFPYMLWVPRPNLISVTSISYLDNNGDSQTLATTEYQVITGEDGHITTAYNKTWPTTREQPEAITIVYTSGYGPSSAFVPQPIKQAILQTAGHWYLDRSCAGESMMPSAKALLGAYQSRDERRLMGV